ncbi:MAG: hypothetical protein Q8891_15840 [Bacteroidota bacterium]|nr:hypothetical protein [Bacteroidota bacterium]
MTTQELIRAIFHRLRKFIVIILAGGILLAIAFIFYALQKPVTYTSRASIFPLTSNSDNSSSPSALGALLGSGENSKNFSNDASINIIELAESRTTRDEVAQIRDSSKGNKTIAELLVDDFNNHRGLFESQIKMPANQNALIIWAGGVLNQGLSASINKNNSFVLSYTGRSPDLVRIISYGFIDKISKFYIDLKREKAKRDFEFATGKVDSLRAVMNSKDAQLINIDKKTLFTNTSKLEFRVPTENLIADKQMIRQQYANAIANQQNAAYKLQKETPLIKVLDKPEPPYDVKKSSPVLFGIIGFLLGVVLLSGILLGGILLKFFKAEINKVVFGSGNTQSVASKPNQF